MFVELLRGYNLLGGCGHWFKIFIFFAKKLNNTNFLVQTNLQIVLIFFNYNFVRLIFL